jgi:hypothetical protein
VTRREGLHPPRRPPAATHSLDTDSKVAVIYLGADYQAHYRTGQVAAIQGSCFQLDYLDPAGTARRASFDLANPNDVLAVEPVR